MAEIGLVASIVQILSVGAKLSTSLYTFAESIGSAGLEIQIIAKEITLFSAVLNQLRDVLEDCSNQYSINLMQTVEEILDESREGFGRISSVLRQLQKGDDAGKPAEFARRMKFVFVRSKIQVFRGYLESNKSTLQTMLQVLLIRKRFPSLRSGFSISIPTCDSHTKVPLTRLNDSPNVKAEAVCIEQDRELLEGLVVANRLSFANLRKLEKGPAASAIRSSRNEQDAVHPSLDLALLHTNDREHEHGMRAPRTSVGSTASRISEHRSLLEENPEGAVDCLLQRWTAGVCDAAENDAMLERSLSAAAHISPKASSNSRPRAKRIPFRSGEWIPDEVDSDKSDEDVADTDMSTLPSTQLHEQSEERYKAQAKQMISSRNWIIESYGARLHLLIEGTPSGHTEAFQKLKDLFEKMLVDLYWEIGFADSAPEPLPVPSQGSSSNPEMGPGQQKSAGSTSSSLANTKTHQLWGFRSSKESNSASDLTGLATNSPRRPTIVKLVYAMLRHYNKAAASDSDQRTGTTNSDLIAVSESTSECADKSPRSCPHPVTTLVDRLARSSREDIPPVGSPTHFQYSQALEDGKRDVLSAKLGEKALSKNRLNSSSEANGT